MPNSTAPKIVLSKSTYLKGVQCLKSLYLLKKHPELRAPITAGQQAIFDRGHAVGKLAHQLFPGGKDCSVDDARMRHLALQRTQEAIEAGYKVLYEAAFVHAGVMAIIDILVRKTDGWHAFEVKSSVHFSGVYFKDAALQYYVLNNAIGLQSINLVTIDNTYVRKGILQVEHLFKCTNITRDVKRRQNEITQKTRQQVEMLQIGQMPKVSVGEQCFKPYLCDFAQHCWSEAGAQDILAAPYLGPEAKAKLVADGYKSVLEVPLDLLPAEASTKPTSTETLQIIGGKLQGWMKKLEYPLVFFDIEFLQLAVPEWDHTSPYESLPYMVSFHIVQAPGQPAESIQHIVPDGHHPYLYMAKVFSDMAWHVGSALAYDDKAEVRALRKMAALRPELATALEHFINRVQDLREVFVQKWVVVPGLGAGTSLKKVLPLLCEGQDFNDLVVTDGFAAARHCEKVYATPEGPEKDHALAELKAYAERDTWAMYSVWQALALLV